jgi:hypothetical protein
MLLTLCSLCCYCSCYRVCYCITACCCIILVAFTQRLATGRPYCTNIVLAHRCTVPTSDIQCGSCILAARCHVTHVTIQRRSGKLWSLEASHEIYRIVSMVTQVESGAPLFRELNQFHEMDHCYRNSVLHTAVRAISWGPTKRSCIFFSSRKSSSFSILCFISTQQSVQTTAAAYAQLDVS